MSFGQDRYLVDWDEVGEESINHLIDLIQIDTSNPPGNETEAANYVKAALAAEGIDSELFALDPDRANLVARIKGNGSKRPILIMGHTDVVGVQAERWDEDPFGGPAQRWLDLRTRHAGRQRQRDRRNYADENAEALWRRFRSRHHLSRGVRRGRHDPKLGLTTWLSTTGTRLKLNSVSQKAAATFLRKMAYRWLLFNQPRRSLDAQPWLLAAQPVTAQFRAWTMQ